MTYGWAKMYLKTIVYRVLTTVIKCCHLKTCKKVDIDPTETLKKEFQDDKFEFENTVSAFLGDDPDCNISPILQCIQPNTNNTLMFSLYSVHSMLY